MKQKFSREFQKAKLYIKQAHSHVVNRMWGLAKHLEPSHVKIEKRKPKRTR